MKSLHFCMKTPIKTKILQSTHIGDFIETYRTGWIPTIYPGDIIKLNYRDENKKDTWIRTGQILDVIPVKYSYIKNLEDAQEDILAYNRKFHLYHWFFKIQINIINVSVSDIS